MQLHPAGSLALTVGDGVVIDRLHFVDHYLQDSKMCSADEQKNRIIVRLPSCLQPSTNIHIHITVTE